MSELRTDSREWVHRIMGSLDRMLVGIENLAVGNRPVLGGERYLTDKEVSAQLKLSRRTLQDYRNEGRISYYQLGGKILYRESDIEKMLQDYISLQYESIQRIFDLINPDYSIPELTYIWQDTPSFLLEIGNSLLVTGKVIPIDNKSNKNNWYKALFHFLHLAEPRYIDQPLYKLNHRENPARYLSSLLKQYEKWLSERV